jgi:acyl-CoA synthetase (AMP-forming)/AMP-acid ligase II
MSLAAPIHESQLGRATLGDQLRRRALSVPDKPAFVTYDESGGRRVTSYGVLNEHANRFAHALLDLGVQRGDRVAVMGRNRVETAITYYGALKVGAAYSGINAMFGPSEVAAQLQHLRPHVVVAGDEFTGLLDDVRAPTPEVRYIATGPATAGSGWHSLQQLLEAGSATEPDCAVTENDLAMIVYTSGTEAEPKGVMITHRNYLISTSPAWSWGLRVQPDDVWLYVMPFHTIAGIGSMTTLTTMGATLVLPSPTDAGTSLRLIRDERITVIAQTPTFYIALAEHQTFGPQAVGTVARCMTYGGQVSPRAFQAWSKAAPGVAWGTYWGQSELSQLGCVGWFRRLEDIPERDPAWIGKPLSHLDIRVVDADGHPGEVGELLCRSPSVMSGYFRDPQRTAAVLRDGWLHTGDIVRTDGDGNLFFVDRCKDMIKTGGLNVSSQEVERVLQAHPGVVRAAVVGLPDDYWSEVVTAFVIVADDCDVTAEDLRQHCRSRIAGYKVPKVVHLVTELPTDSQGKVLKRELRRHHGRCQSSMG